MNKTFLISTLLLSVVALGFAVTILLYCLRGNNQGYITSDKIGVEYSGPLHIYPQIDKASSGGTVEMFVDYGLRSMNIPDNSTISYEMQAEAYMVKQSMGSE